tara:strand:+ start:1550 stop:1819 length:270 start_codon:yes stop_codon:yes gene_type:complete
MDDENIIKFPSKEPEQPKEEIKDYWECKCCGVHVDENSEKKVLPISMGGDPSNPQHALTFYICPNCFTLQMPEELFDEMQRRMNSRIIQ